MTNNFKSYAKRTFWKTSLYFGGSMALYLLITDPIFAYRYDTWFRTIVALMSGFVFTVLIFASTWLYSRFTSRKEKAFAAPIQKKTIVIHDNAANAINICQNTLKAAGFKGIKKIEASEVRAHSSMNYFTWGTSIAVRVTPIDETTTELNITCRPRLKTIMHDCGESYLTLEKVDAALQTSKKSA